MYMNKGQCINSNQPVMYIYLLEVTKQLICMRHSCCASNQFCIIYMYYIQLIHVYIYMYISFA